MSNQGPYVQPGGVNAPPPGSNAPSTVGLSGGGFVAPPKKKGPSCWLFGCLGCLGFIFLLAVAGGFFYSKYSGMIGGLVAKVEGTRIAIKDMRDIRLAILEYKQANGKYPKSLNVLVPKYLPDASELHSTLDDNSSPTHVSYLYVKPTKKTPPQTEILCLSYSSTIVPNASATTEIFIAETLDGRFERSIVQNGQVISRQPVPVAAAPQ